MIEQFTDWKPGKESMDLLIEINDVLEDYQNQGYTLTLRQLYYQLVAGGVIPNNQRQYKRIGSIVNRGRLAGMIDWEAIEDRVRKPESRTHWNGPQSILEAAAKSYHEDLWSGQHYYVEVWCEKDAVSNILEPVCYQWDVTFMANRGYSSQSAMYDAAQRFRDALSFEKEPVLIYFGDHDPSGIDMGRDIQDRMRMFLGGYAIEFERAALTHSQVIQYAPPVNPAKTTDSRYREYLKTYGPDSWELDALKPSVLAQLAHTWITNYLDEDQWNDMKDLVSAAKSSLLDVASTYVDPR